MKIRALSLFAVFLGLVLFSYTATSAQIADKTKHAAVKTKDVTVDTAKKTAVIVTDSLAAAADKTKSAAGAASKVGAATVKNFGGNTVKVTEEISGQAYEGGKWLTVTTWDGAKWVSKREWFPDKKPATTPNQ